MTEVLVSLVSVRHLEWRKLSADIVCLETLLQREWLPKACERATRQTCWSAKTEGRWDASEENLSQNRKLNQPWSSSPDFLTHSHKHLVTRLLSHSYCFLLFCVTDASMCGCAQRCNEQIAHLKDQLQEMKAKTSMESKYLKKDAEVRVGCAQKKCTQDETGVESEVQVRFQGFLQDTCISLAW